VEPSTSPRSRSRTRPASRRPHHPGEARLRPRKGASSSPRVVAASTSNWPYSRSRSPPGALPRRVGRASAYYRSGAGIIGRRASSKEPYSYWTASESEFRQSFRSTLLVERAAVASWAAEHPPRGRRALLPPWVSLTARPIDLTLVTSQERIAVLVHGRGRSPHRRSWRGEARPSGGLADALRDSRPGSSGVRPISGGGASRRGMGRRPDRRRPSGLGDHRAQR
jgi:hypothetical protein